MITPAIEEMLRYDGPIQLNNRRLTAPITLGGTTLPEGAFVTLGIGAANRDPRQFADAERFDVARKPNRHVAFGHGDHACAGMNVARMEARIAFCGSAEAVPPPRARRRRPSATAASASAAFANSRCGRVLQKSP